LTSILKALASIRGQFSWIFRLRGGKSSANGAELETAQRPYPDPERTVTEAEFVEAKERLMAARLQRDVIYYALHKVDEAGSKSQLTGTAKDQLTQDYETDLKRIDNDADSCKRMVDLYELESAKESLLKNFYEQLTELDTKISELRPSKSGTRWRKR
jgi:hypothetical protein